MFLMKFENFFFRGHPWLKCFGFAHWHLLTTLFNNRDTQVNSHSTLSSSVSLQCPVSSVQRRAVKHTHCWHVFDFTPCRSHPYAAPLSISCSVRGVQPLCDGAALINSHTVEPPMNISCPESLTLSTHSCFQLSVPLSYSLSHVWRNHIFESLK